MTSSEYEIPQPDDAGTLASTPGPASGPALQDPRVVETLVRHDEASTDDLATLAKDPSTARVLDRLREADRWLQSALTDAKNPAQDPAENSADGVTPRVTPRVTDGTAPATRDYEVTAEELYDYGAGPGSTALDPGRRAVVEAYLADRPEEAAWVQGLSRPIPSPIDIEALAPSEEHIRSLRLIPGPKLSAPTSLLRKAPAWFAWAPLAAAALVLAMAFGGGDRLSALDGGLPESPVLRSTRTEALLFPRSRVLAPIADATTYVSRPLFEVTPIRGATEYRFELRGGVDGAFDEGAAVWSSTTTAPSATSDALTVGTYSWSVWVRVDGLERSLGSLPFTVVAAERADIVRSATGVDSDARSTREDVRRLHAAGFLSDARFRARSLPPGDDRAEYLSEDQ